MPKVLLLNSVQQVFKKWGRFYYGIRLQTEDLDPDAVSNFTSGTEPKHYSSPPRTTPCFTAWSGQSEVSGCISGQDTQCYNNWQQSF